MITRIICYKPNEPNFTRIYSKRLNEGTERANPKLNAIAPVISRRTGNRETVTEKLGVKNLDIK